MEQLEPKTTNGKQLNNLLKNWTKKSPQFAIDKFKRVLLMYAFKIKNDDAFIAALYGQNVGDETPLKLRQHLTTNLLRAQHAVEIACDKMHTKEIVVALEWSDNEDILTDILKWAEESSKKSLEGTGKVVDPGVQRVKKAVTSSFVHSLAARREAIKSLTPGQTPEEKDLTEHMHGLSLSTPVPDLRSRRPFSSLFVEGSLTNPEYRDRKIVWDGKTETPTVVEAYEKKIIIGLEQGPILLYNSLDLKCEGRLSHRSLSPRVTCFQCTGLEIIAGYVDGNICIWNIQNESLIQKFSGGSPDSPLSYAIALRLLGSMLVAAMTDDTVRVWKLDDKTFINLISQWNPGVGRLKRVDILKLNDIVLLDAVQQSTRVYDLKGYLLQNLDSSCSNDMVVKSGRVITADGDSMIRYWDTFYGRCEKTCVGHNGSVKSVSLWDRFLISHEDCGKVLFWCSDAALKPEYRVIRINGLQGFRLPSLGQDFFVMKQDSGSTILVTDFM